MQQAPDLQALTNKLILACRIVASEGHEDMQMGHVSARHPHAPDRMLIKRAGIGLEEVWSAEDIMTVDFEGRLVEGQGKVHGEWPIHTEVYRMRPDVNAVVHGHPPHAVALSLTQERLGPAGQPGAFFPDGVPHFETMIDIITTREQAAEMARSLGDAPALILRSHGVVVCGASIEEACVAAVLLERAAKLQWIARVFGEIDWPPRDQSKEKKVSAHSTATTHGRWDYLVRKLARTERRDST